MKAFNPYKRLTISVLIIAIGSFFLLLHFKKSNDLLAYMEQIEPDDKTILEDFFHELLVQDRFAYVLLGTKPMALAVFHKSMPEGLLDSHNQALKNGWSVWEKYQNLLPQDNYIFRVFENPDDIVEMIFINKRNFAREFQRYPIESDLLTENKPIAKWLKNFEASSRSFNESFHQNHILEGIAFGFGKHNALMFLKKWNTCKLLEEKYPDQDSDFIADEYDKLSDEITLSMFKDVNSKAKEFIKLPIFATDPDHEETKQLQFRYEKDRKKIIDAFSKKGFLETMLEVLISQK